MFFYLRVEHAVAVVSVGRLLVQTVVAASGVVHVRVPPGDGEQGKHTHSLEYCCHFASLLSLAQCLVKL